MDTRIVTLASTIVTLASTVLVQILRSLPETVVRSILFGGESTPEYSKEFAFNQLLDGYKTSISTLNKAISFNIAFAVLALYVFIALPSEKTMEAPFIGLELSQSTWLQVAPLVAFCLQTFVFTSFLWFMLLRLGQKIVVQQMGEDKGFADVTDIALSGPIAQVWIVIRFGACLHSKWEHHLVSTFVAWTARRAAPLQKSPW